MNILFYLDPSVEFKKPTFRFTSLRNSILPQAKAFLECGHSVSIVISTAIAKKAAQENIVFDGMRVYVIDVLDIMKIGNISNVELSNNINAKQDIVDYFRKALINCETPDLILIWESYSYFFKTLYPKAKTLFQTPGFFSRPPYPQLIAVNEGMLGDSHAPSPVSFGRVSFKSLRDELRPFFKDTLQFNHQLIRLRSKYKHIILLPLQVDGYFMIDSSLKGKRQIDFLVSCLDLIPKDVGVLVTDYRSKDIQTTAITEDIAALLRQKYPNFEYVDEINGGFGSSQQLLPFVDGTISISSSVGLQSVFWQLPTYILDGNYVTLFRTANSIQELLKQIGTRINQDDLIHRAFTWQNIPAPGTCISNADWVHNIIRRANGEPFDWFDGDLNSWLREAINCRKIPYLKAVDYFQNKQRSRSYCHELATQIRKHDVISFDIFDTLLMRPFLSPSDLFKFIEPKIRDVISNSTFDFVSNRRIAEKEAFENAIAAGRSEICIDEIYREIVNKGLLTIEQANKAKEFEIQAEMACLYRRESIYNSYLEARTLGKRIIIASDMYLPKTCIEAILAKNDIIYDKLYLSSDMDAKKSSGKLFDLIIKEENCPPSRILHVGDNLKGDLQIPKSKGIHCFHMPRATEKMVTDPTGFYSLIWNRDQGRHSLSARSVLSVMGNYLYDNAYLNIRKNTLFNADAKNLGYLCFGYLLLGYAKWLCENGIKNEVKDFYFLARDGKIMKEAYDIVSKNYINAPKSHYMLCSRRSVNLCKIKDFSGIDDLLRVEFAGGIKLGFLLFSRFGINSTSISEAILEKHGLSLDKRIKNGDVDALIPFFKDIEEIILKTASSERELYCKYLQTIGFTTKTDKIALVDIGYAGTMQESLFTITGIRTEGYYLMTFRYAIERLEKNGLSSYGYLGNFVDRHDTCQPFCWHVPLFETLFSSTDTSFIKFCNINGKLVPIYAEENKKEGIRKAKIKTIHEGALNFIRRFSDSFGMDLKMLDIEPFKSQRMLISYFNNPDPRDAKVLQGIIFEDAYGGKAEKVILPLDINFVGEVVWKKGLESIKKAEANSKPSRNVSILHNIADQEIVDNEKGIRKVIKAVYSVFLSEPRYNKLRNTPELFFKDSSNFITKNIVSKLYL